MDRVHHRGDRTPGKNDSASIDPMTGLTNMAKDKAVTKDNQRSESKACDQFTDNI
tara:strand:- start:259 stop:423 length:165 start_codon:yes stop_codon:yes gene_type:complete